MKPEQLTDEQRRSKALSAWAAVGVEIAKQQSPDGEQEPKAKEKEPPLEEQKTSAPSE